MEVHSGPVVIHKPQDYILGRPKSLDPYIQMDRIADKAVFSTHVCESSSSEGSGDEGSESD